MLPVFEPHTARLLLALESKHLPMHAADYRLAAVLLAQDCQALSEPEQTAIAFNCPPGVEVLVENEFFNRHQRLLLSGPLEAEAVRGQWALLAQRIFRHPTPKTNVA